MPRMTASRGVDDRRDPRLEKVEGFGRSVAQPPLELPVVEHKGARANPSAITKTKNKVLKRKHYQQLVNAALRRGQSPERAWLELASRPGRK